MLVSWCVCAPEYAVAQAVPDTDEFRINTYTISSQYWPRVVADDSGGFLAAWIGFHPDPGPGLPSQTIITTKLDPNGRPVGGEFVVGPTQLSLNSPALAVRNFSQHFVVWTQKVILDPRGSRLLFGRILDDEGAPIEPDFSILTPTNYEGEEIDVRKLLARSAPNGDVVLAWYFEPVPFEARRVPMARHYSADGIAQGQEFPLVESVVGLPIWPDIAVTAFDEWIAVYQALGQDGSGDAVVGRRFMKTGELLGSEFVINTYTTGRQGGPSIEAIGADRFVVVWESLGQDGDSQGLFGQMVSSDGTHIGSEFQVNSYTTSSQVEPTISRVHNDGFLVAWRNEPEVPARFGEGDLVSGRVRLFDNSGGAVGTEFQLNTIAEGFVGRIDSAGDQFGNVVVVWDVGQADMMDVDVYGRRFLIDPTCGDSNGDRSINAGDAMQTLLSAVGARQCALCVCDADGNALVTASDALLGLQAALDPAKTLDCPLCL